ncbi:MAG: alpha/beta fold hydrolase [Spirochaetaceae bacterium]|nr:MAG: alpha/beta fold hydrolase [Spirochaetaceae bacterium]
MTVLLVTIFVITVLGIVYLLGPRLRFSTGTTTPQLPGSLAELVEWLAWREAQYADIVEGTQKEIVWRQAGAPSRSCYAVVYVHGFSASRREIDPFPQLVADALNANLFYTRLCGHGSTDPDAMGRALPSQWYQDALEALAVGRAIGERIVLVATSTGATLSTALAERFSDQIHALVAVSPNYGPATRIAWLTAGPWGVQLARLLLPNYLNWESSSELHERFWTTRYPGTAIPALMSLVAYGRRIDHRALRVPLIQFSAPGDQVIDYRWSIRVFERWGTAAAPRPPKNLVLVHDSSEPEQHVITGEIRSPENTERLAALAVEFLRELR